MTMFVLGASLIAAHVATQRWPVPAVAVAWLASAFLSMVVAMAG